MVRELFVDPIVSLFYYSSIYLGLINQHLVHESRFLMTAYAISVLNQLWSAVFGP
ncbi:hypothetical protein [[Phormidium ambiguum] IAM M-71]|uniref:hypothetical protein n=1 Tax=[Phormidium ambiguum] IAM M-71 TaxID=454136 RepID=UPI0015C11024|nr:hypothetical protein [Phormidium ambiguum]